MNLFVVACDFKLEEYGETHRGIAICSDPYTPVTFVYKHGKPHLSTEIWSYILKHYQPWASFEVNDPKPT